MNQVTREIYAVKAFSKTYLKQNNDKVKSLKGEISKMRRLHHPNIVELIEVQETKNSVYLVMEYIEGKPIICKNNDTPESIDKIRTIMRTLLRGIQYLAQQQIVHKDLKPYNILFKENNNPSTLKILDFGLAADLNNELRLFTIAGTPGFMAPELFKCTQNKREAGLDSKMDVFSAGVIFHGYLFKSYIFSGKTSKEVYKNNKECEFEIQGLNKIDENLRCPLALDLLKRMLEKNSKDRCSISEALKHEFFLVEKKDFEVPSDPVSQASIYLGKNFKRPVLLTQIKGKYEYPATDTVLTKTTDMRFLNLLKVNRGKDNSF